MAIFSGKVSYYIFWMSWYILITLLSDSLKLLYFCWVFMLRIWYKFHVSFISGVMTVWILVDICVLKWKQPVHDKSTLNSADKSTPNSATRHKLNVHKTFRNRPGRLLNVLCTFNLYPVSRGYLFAESLYPRSQCQLRYLRLVMNKDVVL